MCNVVRSGSIARRLDHPDLIWGSWLAATLTSFALLERRALRKNKQGVTLSAFIKRWLGITPRRPWSVGGSLAFAAGLTWLGFHILADLAEAAEDAMTPDDNDSAQG